MKQLSNIKNVAVIGASNNPKKLGFDIVSNLTKYDFKGTIYPISLKEEQIQGYRAYRNISQINEHIDMAVIVVPAITVKEVVKEACDKLVDLIVIITAGFKEASEEGKHLEEEIKEIVKNSQSHLIGPNCLGVISSSNGLNASFAANFPHKDPISLISQSGAIGTAFLDWISEHNLGINNFISIGNKTDIDENTLLASLTGDKVIAMYLESIQNGKKLMQLGFDLNPKRPVLVLKPGRSEEGAKAISSHTGALAGGHNAISTALKQSGYLEVATIGELFHKVMAFAWQPIPNGNRIAIITNAGGPAVVTTDLLSAKGLKLAKITEKTEKILKEKLPRTANIHNPIDVIGDALSDRYFASLDALLREEEVDAVIVILTPQIMTEIEKTAKVIGDMKKYNKPILAAFIGGSLVDHGIKLLSEEKIPAFHFPEIAVEVLSSMVEYSNFLKKDRSSFIDTGTSTKYGKNRLRCIQLLTQAKAEGLTSLPSKDAEEIASLYGINVPNSFTATNIEEALHLAKTQAHYPVTLKISSPYLLHKSDIGGIINDIQNEEGLRNSFDKLESIIANRNIKDAKIEIQTYLNKGHFVIVGATRDESFGTVLLFGEGGIYTEIIKDLSRRIAPVSKDEIEEMINETIVSKILHGTRGENPFDIKGIIDCITSVQEIMQDYPMINSIDINPIIVTDETSIAVDIKILI